MYRSDISSAFIGHLLKMPSLVTITTSPVASQGEPWTTALVFLSILVLIWHVFYFMKQCCQRRTEQVTDEEEELLKSTMKINLVSAEATHYDIEEAVAALGNVKLIVGKHAGRTFCAAFENDKGYVKWMMDHGAPGQMTFGFNTFIVYCKLR